MAGRPLRRARENGRFAKLPVYAVSVVVKRDPWEMLPEDEPTFSVTCHVQTDKGVDAAEMLGTSRARQEYGADRVLDAEAVPAVDPARGNPKFSGYPKPYGSRPDGFPETDLNKATQFVFNIAGTEVTTRDSRGKYIEVAGRGEAWKQHGNRKGWRIVDYRPESEFYVFIVPPGDFEQLGSRGKRALRRAVDINRDFWGNAPFQVLKREVARRTPETPRDPARARSNPWQDDLNPHGNLQSALHRVSILADDAPWQPSRDNPDYNKMSQADLAQAYLDAYDAYRSLTNESSIAIRYLDHARDAYGYYSPRAVEADKTYKKLRLAEEKAMDAYMAIDAFLTQATRDRYLRVPRR